MGNLLLDKHETMTITRMTVIPKEFYSSLNALHDNALICVKEMVADRSKSSSKYYKSIPCVVAKSLILKYQRNLKLKVVRRLVIPICGDKGKQVKIVGEGLRVPALFKKKVISANIPKNIIGDIRGVELYRRDGKWVMSFCLQVPKLPTYTPTNFLGVDRNSVGNVATIADISTGKFRKLGPCTSSITKNFIRRRARLQKKKAKNALKKLKFKQQRRNRDINHKVSRAVVDYAKIHCSTIVLEDLEQIANNKGAKRYAQKSQWSFFQLETFIKYKAALLGVPVIFVEPAFTSQACSKCGSINKLNGKQYICYKCGYFCHRDVNAAFNISKLGDKAVKEKGFIAGLIGIPLNQKAYKGVFLESQGFPL